MDLLSPWSLAWLGLLAPLVALYVLKRRRQRKVVGSTLLWEAALRDLRAERPWQRLRPHLSLILQALVLVAGAIALARPAGGGQVPAGARLAVVVDVSSSMAAREPDGARIDRARDLARSLARDLPPGGAMMLVAAGAEPEVLAAPTADRARLETAIDRLRVRGPGADLEGAVALAAERLRDAPAGSRIVLLTDAAIAGNVPLDATVPVEVSRVGEPLVNHAIVTLDVRAHPTEESSDRADVFVRVARYGEGTGDVRVRASIEGGRELATRRITLSEGEPTSVVMSADLPPDASARGSVVRVTLEPVDGEDPFTLDDVAVAPSPASRRLPVFLVGSAPASVTRVLRADREVELYVTSLERLAEREDDAPPLDGLFVYAGATPDDAPAGDSVVVAPTGAAVFGVALEAPVERPTLVSWEEGDPRLRFVRFADVHLGAVRPIAGGSARALLTTDAGAAIAALPRPDGETTLVAFDPDDGDWATRPGFVVFFRNVLERARQRRAAGGIPPGPLGAPLRVPVPEGQRATVRTPGGATVVATSRGGVAVVDVPAEPGVFVAEVDGRERFALRNLVDPEESDLRPRATFTRSDGSGGVATVEAVEHREAWPWIAGALLALLGIEVLWGTRKGAPA
ncbi:MAG: BatA domain-containing protein [Sandaracinaceae bacterium]|nr:BatA domain-containing protein [Sandaracinaceae bacterium]